MASKFSQGDRVTVCDEEVACRLKIASRDGAVVQGNPEEGEEGTFEVMFDGADLPLWVTGVSLKPIL